MKILAAIGIIVLCVPYIIATIVYFIVSFIYDFIENIFHYCFSQLKPKEVDRHE